MMTQTFKSMVISIFTTLARGTTGGYVFTGVCLFRGVPRPLVSGPFSTFGPTILSRERSPVTGPLQSPVPGSAGAYPQTGHPSSTPRDRTGSTPYWTGQGVPVHRASDTTPRAVRLLRSRRRTFLFLESGALL